jgi:hypothetical protein
VRCGSRSNRRERCGHIEDARQAFAADGTASQDVIKGASVAAVQVSSDPALTGDFAGQLTVSFSGLSGNAARS